MLHAVVGQLSHAMESSAYAGSKYEPLGRALVFRLAARSLHVVGDTPLAAEFRRLVTAGAVPGWDLYPEPVGRTPLRVLAGPLHRPTASPPNSASAASASASSRPRHCGSLRMQPRTTGTVRSDGARHRQHSPMVDMPPLSLVHPRGWATCSPG